MSGSQRSAQASLETGSSRRLAAMANSAVSCGAVSEHHTECEHPFDLDLQTIRCRRTAGTVIIIVEDAVDAFDQPLEFGPIELIGTAETMHHAGLSAFCLRVPDALGEGVVADG